VILLWVSGHLGTVILGGIALVVVYLVVKAILGGRGRSH
jgi:hypothetical protein